MLLYILYSLMPPMINDKNHEAEQKCVFQSRDQDPSHLDIFVADGESSIMIVLDCIIYTTLKYQCITWITIIKCFTPQQIITSNPPPNFRLKMSRNCRVFGVKSSVKELKRQRTPGLGTVGACVPASE